MVKLKKSNLEITVKKKGAELVSVKYNDEEFLWNKKEVWAKSSPILFPFIGMLKDNKYIYAGKEYNIDTRHGFARDMDFELNVEGDNTISCRLMYNDKTLEKYPFKFVLIIKYMIVENSLKMIFIVENIDDKTMYFSIGSHPAFVLSNNYEDYYIQLDDKQDLMRYELEDLKYLGEKTILYNSDRIYINDKIFENDAIIFDGSISEKSIIRNIKNSKSITITHKGFTYLAYWRPIKAPFVCVESWYGVTDTKNHNYNIEDKKSIEKLEKGKKFETELVFNFKN